MKIKVGFGFDVHQLVEGRELWLGGILLEHEKGLLGHSDADVLVHAICDACWVLPTCVISVITSLTMPVNIRI